MTIESTRSFAVPTAGLTWRKPDELKNLLLIFDGVVSVVPQKFQDRVLGQHEWLVAGLSKNDALVIVDPEELFDDDTATAFVSQLTEALADPEMVDALRQSWAYRGISINSRFTGLGATVGDLMVEELGRRGLVRARRRVDEYREFGLDVFEYPVPLIVNALIRSLWVQAVTYYGLKRSQIYYPVTDDAFEHDYPTRVLQPVSGMTQERYILRGSGSADRILAQLFVGDIHKFGIDVSAAPVEDVIDFRRNNKSLLDGYMQSLRNLAVLLTSSSGSNINAPALVAHSELMSDQAADIRRRMKMEFAINSAELGVAVSAIMGATASRSFLGAILAGVTTAAAAAKFLLPENANEYRYLLVTQERFGYRPWN